MMMRCIERLCGFMWARGEALEQRLAFTWLASDLDRGSQLWRSCRPEGRPWGAPRWYGCEAGCVGPGAPILRRDCREQTPGCLDCAWEAGLRRGVVRAYDAQPVPGPQP